MYISRPRDERKEAIVKLLTVRAANGWGGLSMRQIARGLDMSQSGHLMSILWDMVDEGKLIAHPVDWRPGITAWRFTISIAHYGVGLDKVYGEKSA